MPISIEADPTLAQGYIKVNGTTAATVTSTGLTTASLQDAAVTTTKVNDAAITAPKLSGGQAGSAPIYGCRAWVNFNGTRNAADTGASTNGGNVLIRASGNVSSVLKNGTGDYTVTFTTAMQDANYCVNSTAMRDSTNSLNASVRGDATYGNGFTTNSIRINTRDDANTAVEALSVSVSIFR